MILNIKNNKELPVYGNGKNIRDWIYVEDHCRGIWQIVKKSLWGQKWNIGGDNELENLCILDKIMQIESAELKIDLESIKKRIVYVKDRPGHDKRYALDCTKIKKNLGWEQKMPFEEGLLITVRWYLKNQEWISHIHKDF